jgi:periplasmic protein TonB
MQSTQRQGFLLSGLVHVIMITLLIRTAIQPAPLTPSVSPAVPPSPRPRAVFLPPPAELRRLAPPAPRRPGPRPVPAPTPPPVREARDKISIGPPSTLRQREPLLLEKDRDLSSSAAAPGAPGAPATPEARPAESAESRGGDPVAAATPAPAGTGQAPLAPPPPGERSIASSLRNLEKRLGDLGAGGLDKATGQQMGPLFFDPEGADFTAWINHFKNEIYRNWIVPQGVLFGALRGHVDFEFTIERDGTLSALRLLKSSGTGALDRSAANALLGARSLPLPSDYRPARVTIQISFFYNESPRS